MMATQRAPETQSGAGMTTSQGGVAPPPGITVQARTRVSAPAPAARPHHGSQPAPSMWAPAALHVAALLFAVGALVPEAVFLNQRSIYNLDMLRGWDIATAPGLALTTSVLALVLVAVLLACRHLITRSAGRASGRGPPVPACSPVLAAAVVAQLEVAMLVLWIASVAVGAVTADKVHRYGSHRVWTRCNALMLAFASASVLTWGAALVCSLRALLGAVLPGCGCGDGMYEPLLAAEAGSRAGSPTGSDDSTTPRFVIATRGGDQPPTPPLQPARLTLHAVAAVLAIGVIVAQGILMGHFARVWGSKVPGAVIADKPAFVMATAAATAAVAGALLVLHCLPGARRLWAAAAAAAPSLAMGGAAMELLLSCTLMSLWGACLEASVRTLQWLYKGRAQAYVWISSNSAALALECVCVVVWAAAVGVAAAAFVRQAWPWWARRVAIARAAGTCVSREVRLLLLVMGSLLAVGVLAAQATLMNRFDYYTNMTSSILAAVAPVLVIVTASAALVIAVVVLMDHGAGNLLDSIDSIVRLERGDGAEALAAACVLGLWVASLGVSAKTADVLRKGYGIRDGVWCNTTVLLLECASVLVWGAVVALAVGPVGRAVGALVSEWTTARGGAYQRLAGSQQAADAGKFAGEPGTEASGPSPAASRTIAIRGAAPRALMFHVPQLGRYSLALLLAIGVLQAQSFLIHDYAYVEEYSGSGSYRLNGKDFVTAPNLIIVTAAVTIAAAALGLLWSCVITLSPVANAAVVAPSGMSLAAAIVEAEVVGVIWALWVVSVGALASSAHTLLKHPYSLYFPWTVINAAVLAMACISVLIWGTILSLTADRVVGKLRGGQPQPAAADMEDQSAAAESPPLLAPGDAAP